MEMSSEEREATVRRIVAEVAGVDAGTVEAEMDLVGDLGIDSPKALQLLVSLEEALEVEISDEEAAKMDSVGDIDAYVASL